MRKFLYLIIFGVLLVAVVLVVLRLYSQEITQIALVPSAEFAPQEELADNAYGAPDMWFSRPGMGAPNDPARWQPAYVDLTSQNVAAEEAPASPPTPAARMTAASEPEAPAPPPFAVFFVHPTSYFDSQNWNAALDDAQSQDFARIFVRGLGSAYNQASEIWAPKYRQATFGAFLSGSDEAGQAVDAAYADVAQAFDYFAASISADTPIVLAGHSQGSLHILRLLREKIAGSDLQPRIAMAYPIGWPISVEHDLPGLPLPACATPDQASCLVTWASFADGGDPGLMLGQYSESTGFDGNPRGDSAILCVNPLNGMINGSANASNNLGTLVPSEDLTTGELVPAGIPASCNDDGLLMIGNPPEMGAHVLPLNNYHIYDIPLFWANLQADVVRRVNAWQTAR